MKETRTQAQRDAGTVEIGHALLTGALQAGLCVLVFLKAPPLLSLPEGPLWPGLAFSTATTVFVVRVVRVLSRFGRTESERSAADAAGTVERAGAAKDADGAQPSQPGRTSPDS